MAFNSLNFLYFFLATAAVFFLAPLRLRWIVLLLASAVFYGWSNPVYVLLLAATVVSTWYSGLLMDRSATLQQRKRIMQVTLLFNVLILVVFKYLGFFNELIGLTNQLFHAGIHFAFPELLVRVSISFYTFICIGYVLDVYFKIRKPEPHLGYYAVFGGFFPQLLSGPIARSSELLPQIREPRSITWPDIEIGISRFAWGLMKKLVVADRIGLLVDDVYANPKAHFGMTWWFISVLYAFQLYADFSAYTDMAIGSARIFGIRLAENFDFPYISKNVTEFWRRWHISLSNWLRDYLYTPILFSKKKWGKKAVVYAIMITFLICGLWHGAKFTFVIFGILQGAALAYEMQTRQLRAKWNKTAPKMLYNFFSWALTFLFIVFCFIFFRAETTPQAFLIVKREFTSFWNYADFMDFLSKENISKVMFSLLICVVFFLCDRPVTLLLRQELPERTTRRAVLLGVLCAFIIALGVYGKADFIYAKF